MSQFNKLTHTSLLTKLQSNHIVFFNRGNLYNIIILFTHMKAMKAKKIIQQRLKQQQARNRTIILECLLQWRSIHNS